MNAIVAKGVERVTTLRNMEVISSFYDLAVQAIHGNSDTFNFEFGTVTESGTPVENLYVWGECSTVVEYNFGGASVSASVYWSCCRTQFESAWRRGPLEPPC